MKLLLSWVRDFVDVTVPAESLAETMALRGFEVASVESLAGDDAVIDFEVTANRPDCLSVLGFAREIATTYMLPLRLPSTAPDARVRLATIALGESDHVHVRLEDAELCPRYVTAVADVTPTSSPAWMTSRLQAAGVRPISPIVDITNYVLLELGQPLHAFDLETLDQHQIRIRRALPGEQLTTLDGVSRTLEPDMLVIADATRAQAVAGVMGGGVSEVTARTRRVAFESAYFKPASIRRTSKRLGLKTEASTRFERGADINGPVVALQRALALMNQIGAGQADGVVVDRYAAPKHPRVIVLRKGALGRLLGLDVPDAEVTRILTSLGLTVETDAADGATPRPDPLASVVPSDLVTDDTRQHTDFEPMTSPAEGWRVTVPTARVDLLREVDLIEEVGRHWGFDKLTAAFPVMTAAAAPPDPRVARDHLVRKVMTSAGLSEAVTFGFIETKAAEAFVVASAHGALVPITNPLSAKFDVLRPSLLPGLVDAVAHNRRHGRRDVALFEIGARFSTTDGETRGVGLAWTGAPALPHWSGTDREVDFFDAKGLVESLGEALRVSARLIADDGLPYLVAGQAARIVVGETTVGAIGQVAPELVDRAGAPRQDRIIAAELNLDLLAAHAEPRAEAVQPLPRHPAVVRDLSIVVSAALPAENIRGTILTAGRDKVAPLTAVGVFDRYQGKGVPEGSVSVSVRMTFQSTERTLTDAEVQQAFDTILSALVREHGAVQR